MSSFGAKASFSSPFSSGFQNTSKNNVGFFDSKTGNSQANQAQQSGSFFGASLANQPSNNSSFFGTSQNQQSGSFFNSNSSFGSKVSTQSQPSSFFGSSQTQGASLFTTNKQTPFFGSSQINTADTSAASFSFANAANNQPADSLFGSSSNTVQDNQFGSSSISTTTSFNSNSQGSVFGLLGTTQQVNSSYAQPSSFFGSNQLALNSSIYGAQQASTTPFEVNQTKSGSVFASSNQQPSQTAESFFGSSLKSSSNDISSFSCLSSGMSFFASNVNMKNIDPDKLTAAGVFSRIENFTTSQLEILRCGILSINDIPSIPPPYEFCKDF